jgi:hypothetical protein
MLCSTQDKASIDNLLLQDPLPSKQARRLKGAQIVKGLPANYSREIINNLFHFAKLNGFESVKAPGSQNYITLNYYRRTFGLVPASEDSTKFINHLDHLYAFTRNQKINGQQIKTLNEFSDILGHYQSPRGQEGSPESLAWEKYLRENVLLPNMSLIKETPTTTLGFVLNGKIFFLSADGQKVFNYRAAEKTGILSMKKAL